MVQTANTKDMYYTCTDYLDNINLVINQSKTVAQENSFDAWGRRRNVNTWSHTNVTNPTLLQRGYTGHEHLDDFGLINMNARLYDPLIGRMLSPDNVLFDVTNSQNYNKYTYVLNNPLRYTDPTGNVPQGGLSQALTPGGLSHAGFNAAYMEFRAQTAQEEKNQMLEQLLMDAGGGGSNPSDPPSYTYVVYENGTKKTFIKEAVVSGASVVSGSWLDNIQTGLDIAGIADPTGVLDGVNAIIYAFRGNWSDAGISAMAILPVGDMLKVGRLGSKALKFNENQQALIKLAKEAERAGGVTLKEAEILRSWAKEYDLPFRGPEIHPNRNFNIPHIHIGPVNHLPIKP